MKQKLTIISSLVIAVTSVCLLQPVNAAETEAKKEAKNSGTNGEKGNLSAADKKFVENAAKGGMMEVAMGKVAAKQAQSSEVKKFGSRMVSDHSKANSELKGIAKKKGLTLPAEPAAENFTSDANYMAMMVKDHEKDLSEFQKEARSGSDADLKAFADKTAKVVSEHLAQARQINKGLKHQNSNLTR